MDERENKELCPFCLVPRDDTLKPVLTMNRTYLVCGHCTGGAEPRFWQPSLLVRVLHPQTEVLQ